MKKLIIIILLIFTGINLYAQCYKGNISLGNYAKSKGNYTEAIRYFKKAKLCSDKPTNDSLDELISECERLQSAPKKTQPQQRKTQTQQSKPSVILKVDGHSDVCNQNLYSYGSSIVFSITTNQSYYYITDAQNKWFSVTKEGKEIRVKYPANNTGSVRSGYFYVKAGNKSVRVNLRQYSETPALRDYSLSVSPESYTFPAYGGQTKIYVNTNSPSGYTLAQTHSSMFKITAQYSDYFIVECNTNYYSSSRDDYFVVKAGNKEKRITINQKGRTTTVQTPDTDTKSYWRDSYSDSSWPYYYDGAYKGVYFSWTRRQLSNTLGYDMLKTNIWGDEGKWLEGGSFGLQFFPSFDWGLGAYTGVFFEIYYSTNSDGSDKEFGEVNMYIPLDVSFRIPFSRHSALYMYGGLGMDIGIFNVFYWNQYDYSGSYDQEYENAYGDWSPKRFSLSWNYGVALRLNKVMFNFNYQHGFYPESHIYDEYDVISKWNKLQFGFSIFF